MSRVGLGAVDLASNAVTAWAPPLLGAWALAASDGHVLVATPPVVPGGSQLLLVNAAGAITGIPVDIDGAVVDIVATDDLVIIGGSYDTVGGFRSSNFTVFDGTATPPSGAPQNLQVTVAGNQVALTWVAPRQGRLLAAT